MSGKLSPHNVDMPSISPLQACPSVVGVPTTPFDHSPKDAFSSSIVAKLGIFFPIILFQLSIFYFLLPEAFWCCSLQPIFLFCQDRVLFLVYPFNRSVVSSAQVLSILSSFISLFIQSVVRICNSLFTLSYRSAFNFIYLRCILFSIWLNLFKVLWFHSFVKEAT